MFWLRMNNPPPDLPAPLLLGDPAPSQDGNGDPADPAARLRNAERNLRLAEAKNLSRRYVLVATGLALLPIPLLDIAAVLGLQVKLVHDLAQLYEVPFEPGFAKPLLASLLSCGAVSGGGLLLMGLGMTVPGLKTLVGGGYSASLAGTTLATSEIFIRHFEAGGNLSNFNATVPGASDEAGSVGLSSTDLERIYGIGATYHGRLRSAGITDFAALAALQPEVVKQILGSRVSLSTARDFIAQAKVLAQLNST